MFGSVEIGREECEALLASDVVGRVALSTPTGPHIVAVDYAVIEDTIVFRASPYSLVGTYGRDALLAFEIDNFATAGAGEGWSVVATGRGEVVTESARLDRIRGAWPPRRSLSGVRHLVLRLPLAVLTGTRRQPAA
jgi:uncharacterized protein